MNKFRNILKSGAREMTIVSPHPSCNSALLAEARSLDYRTFAITEAAHAIKGSVNLVSFSPDNEELVTAYAIYSHVLPPYLSDSSKVSEIYSYLRQTAGNILSIRDMMRRLELKSYYIAREYVSRFISAGLFFPVEEVRYPKESETGRRWLVPYYYHGYNSRVLSARRLLSLGYDLSSLSLPSGSVCDLYGKRHGESIAVLFGDSSAIDIFREAPDSSCRIIITEGERIPNFSAIQSCTIEEFLSSEGFF